MKTAWYAFVLIPMVILLSGSPAAASDYVRVVAETAAEITLAVDIPRPELKPAGTDQALMCSIEGFGTVPAPGCPGVPVYGFLVDVPPGCSVELHVETTGLQEQADIDLAPAPLLQPVSDPAAESRAVLRYVKDQAAYRQDDFYPGHAAALEFVGNLRDRRVAKINVFPVQYNPVRKTLRAWTRMRLVLSLQHDKTADNSQRARTSEPSGVNSVFQKIYAASILDGSTPAYGGRIAAAGARKTAQISGELSQSPFAIKLITEEPGMYRVDYDDLDALGVDLSGLTHGNLKIENQGREIAVYRSGSGPFARGDYIIFHAEDFQSEYSRKNVYWLYQGTTDGSSMQSEAGAPVSGYVQPSSFANSLHLEENLTWEQALPDYSDGEDLWFWQQMNVHDVSTFDIMFRLDNFATTAGDFSIEVYLRGETSISKYNPDHQAKIYLNNTAVGEFSWDGKEILQETIADVSPGLFTDGENTITIEALNEYTDDPANTPDSYFLNWVTIQYADRFVAENDRLRFTADASGGATFAVSGFSSPDIMVFDVSRAAAPVLVSGTSISTSGSSSAVRFERSVGDNATLYAVAAAGFLSPAEIVVDTASSLSGTRSDVDYIIITHAEFADTVARLQDLRERSGLGVAVVDVQDIYDEYSYGIKDLAAIRDFLAHAYDSWHATDHPTYVLLVGDATYDYRDDTGLADSGKADLVPTYYGYRTSVIGATATDNWFVCVSGDDYLPDMVIGRLCVKTTTDLEHIIDKIEKYEDFDVAGWQANVIFAADNEFGFESISDTLAGYLPEGYTAQKIYLSDYGDDIVDAREDLIKAISNGAVITNYTGHGATDMWSRDNWFQTPNQDSASDRDDVSSLTNKNKFTFIMVLNCLNGNFANLLDDYSTAEEFLRADNKGAVACLAATAAGYPSEHSVLAQQMYSGLFDDNNTIAGALVTSAKIAAYNQISARDLLETFTFFGDPALGLKLIDPEAIKNFQILGPVDEELVAFMPPPLFEWGQGPYLWFKLQFSSDTVFSAETTIGAPLMPLRFIKSGQYRPNPLLWALISLMGGRNSSLYWRVVAYDENYNPVAYTNYNSIMF